MSVPLNGILLSLLLLVLSGCTALDRSTASVSNGVIRNPSLGFFGFLYQIPDGFELYDPGAEEPKERTALQQMAIRIYNMNEACRVSGANRDSYILMGFSLPEHKHILSLRMKEMIAGFQF